MRWLALIALVGCGARSHLEAPEPVYRAPLAVDAGTDDDAGESDDCRACRLEQRSGVCTDARAWWCGECGTPDPGCAP